MKILHVSEHIYRSSGVTVFCVELCDRLIDQGHTVKLALQWPDFKEPYPLRHTDILISIDRAIAEFENEHWDLVHINGVWNLPFHVIANKAYKFKVPIVWSPHGSLTPWALHHKWWKKLPAWWLYQRNDLTKANILHVTSENEVEDMRRLGLGNQIMIAPLGCQMPQAKTRNISQEGKILFVSRVQKKKGIPLLLKAFKNLLEMNTCAFEDHVLSAKELPNQCKSDAPIIENKKNIAENWRILIVGPDQEGHTHQLKKLTKTLGIEKQVDFLGPKFGAELDNLFNNADLFVLPSHSENFGSVVVEALAHGVPVITTKGTPWRELEENGCGWWVDVGVEPIANALQKAMSLSDGERRNMGSSGRKLVAEKYTWDAVVANILDGYKSVVRQTH